MDEQQPFDREFAIIWLCWVWSEEIRPALQVLHRAFVAAGLIEPSPTDTGDTRG